MNDYLEMADVTDTIKIMDTYRNNNNSDVEDLDYIDLDENIEISLKEEIFDEKSDPEDLIIVDIEEQIAENSVQLKRLPRVIFKDENDIHHVVTLPGATPFEITNKKSTKFKKGGM